ncbi:hypothetical protein [Ignatzschineria cameli]|uniref:Uncharacterized protein n=1 Tax=Ignatzschineria cameli TaxID=2182793 RepID=A0A2U2AQJ9_9GAMM|nr:hypothetical protein [Ignatzschineria cameli]PWD85826.1 hypothetical protein DC077_07280 [Ignatzschineria cameli]PWD89454.1 hypothetical protein DC079_06905 [Ignatzschineria cameli]PWD90926.1 hypothetical protein DC081_06615 [Ignatzschineria cameli]PWD91714.1 hypothetical protein DC078_06900 [Ignatzschineria cameli]
MQQDQQIVKIKVRIGSDPYRLIQSIQGLSPEDVDRYIEEQARKIAYNDAVKEINNQPHRGTIYDAKVRMRRVNSSAKERLPGRLRQLSKYRIKVHRMIELGDGIVEIAGERL